MTYLLNLTFLLSLWSGASSHNSEYSDLQTTVLLHTKNIGPFLISWDDHDPYVEIVHTENPSKILFRTLPMQPFVTIGYATDSKPPIVDGNFKVNEWTLFETPYQSIQRVNISSNEFIMYGEVWGLVTKASYKLKFHIDTAAPNQLFMNLSATPILGTFNRLFLNHWSDPKESFHGFGVQYTHWNLKGLRVPIVVAEQGIGRGMQPLTSLLNVMADGTGGDPLTTYAPKPLYMTSQGRSMVFDNSQIMFFDLRDVNAVVVELWGTELTGSLLYGESMLDLITEVTLLTGRMKPLPAWTQEGAIVGLEGGTEEVQEQVAEMRAHNISITAVWLQDWVGLRHAYDGDRLMWNWVLDPSYYPHWNEMVDKWSQDDIRVLTYINPFFSDPVSAKATSTRTNPNVVNDNSDSSLSIRYRNLFQEGLINKYFVQNKAGTSYRLHSGSIEFCMLDTSNPSAREWMKDIIKYEMIRNTSSSGWMADFGEYLPFDAVLHNGMSAAEYHNIYPQEWAKINEEAVREAKQAGIRQIVTPSNYKSNASADDDDVVYFMRSAWLKSPAHTSLFWLGDQLVSWDRYDGIKTVLVGALSGGLGGHSLTHSDIGGYTMQELGPFPNVRTRELMYRWIELEAFGSAVFRSHIGSLVSPNNVQIYQDKEVMLYFGKFTNIFKHLSVYRKKLMKEAHEKGWPLIRSMAAHFGSDDKTWSIHSQYMFGDEIMVAPVTDPSKTTYNFGSRNGRNSISLSEFADYTVRGAKVYIPANTEWIHLWSGQTVQGGEQGRYVSVDVPFGCIPVFYVPGSEHGEKLREFIVSNHYDAELTVVTIPDVKQDHINDFDFSGLSHEEIDTTHPLKHLLKTSRHVSLKQDEFQFARPTIGAIVTFEEKTSWMDWFGLSEFVKHAEPQKHHNSLSEEIADEVSSQQQRHEIAPLQEVIELYQNNELAYIVPATCFNVSDIKVARGDTLEFKAESMNYASTLIYTTAIIMAAVDMSSSLLHHQ